MYKMHIELLLIVTAFVSGTFCKVVLNEPGAVSLFTEQLNKGMKL